MRIGVMKDSKTKAEESTRLPHVLGCATPAVMHKN